MATNYDRSICLLSYVSELSISEIEELVPATEELLQPCSLFLPVCMGKKLSLAVASNAFRLCLEQEEKSQKSVSCEFHLFQIKIVAGGKLALCPRYQMSD